MKLLAATIIFSTVFVTVEAKGTRNGEMFQNYKPQELLGLDLDLPPVQQQLRQAEDWTAALEYVASKGTDRSLQEEGEEEEEEDDDDTTPPQPYLPDKFTFTGDITQSGTDPLNTIQPLSLQYAVSGNDGSLSTYDGTSLYFQMDDYNCSPNETESRSFQVSNFEVNTDSNIITEQLCFQAPPGFKVDSNNIGGYKTLLQTTSLLQQHTITYLYAGQFESTTDGLAHLWLQQTLAEANSGSPSISTLLATSASSGVPLYYKTRVIGLDSIPVYDDGDSFLLTGDDFEIRLTILNFEAFDADEVVPNAIIDSKVKEDCFTMLVDDTWPCQGDHDTVEEISDLQNEAIVQFLSGGTGTDGGLDEGLDDYLEEQEQFGAAYPTTEIPYEIIGDQKMVRNLEIFVSPMNGRPYLPVVSQSMTGACYAFSATHAIGSQYAQVNPGELLMFSVPEAMNCQPIEFISNCTDSDGPMISNAGTGTWGGLPYLIIDWLVANGSTMSLVQTLPFTGIQGTCNTTAKSIQTGIKGYSMLRNKAEMKNAIYNHGDISVSLGAGPMLDWIPSEDVSWPHFLGTGLSGYASDDELDHAVNIIGWGPCLVPEADDDNLCGTDYSTMIIGECWIVQNSWGIEIGHDGFYFINTDENCDLGVSLEGIIPLR
ncbi:cysteine proteinase [Fragilariopsis cylindrus CCMP1102]|uniref:Cysteine proteinase n=1 Tax=Fragilariopsis cylindrus CCMP1102 TaxID=635003 RepID=A0A1E7ERV4_9STRA|nr:cysteine proteinase [Fragilariopsis cylindrus CCMP1102]|eukprot:OEU08579.1 cysteine proteinase [Fragilariopsis cylindrus CCMP1102]